MIDDKDEQAITFDNYHPRTMPEMDNYVKFLIENFSKFTVRLVPLI